MKVAYPTIFTETDSNILIEIPDLKILTEANSEGKKKKTLADAIMVARDAIGMYCVLAEEEGKNPEESSDIRNVKVENTTFYEEGKTFVSIVDVDLQVYRKKNDMKMVRRNVTLPNWMNREAEAAHINVSGVLQEALLNILPQK